MDGLDRLTDKVPGLENLCLRKWELRTPKPCVYFLVRNGKVVYVGQSKALESRLSSHVADKCFDSVQYLEMKEYWPFCKAEISRIEAWFILLLQPKYNRQAATPSGRASLVSKLGNQYVLEENGGNTFRIIGPWDGSNWRHGTVNSMFDISMLPFHFTKDKDQ